MNFPIATEVVAAICSLVGIVEFLGEIGGIIGKKGGAAIFDGPDDSVGGALAETLGVVPG